MTDSGDDGSSFHGIGPHYNGWVFKNKGEILA
jgi:hypothetical protein